MTIVMIKKHAPCSILGKGTVYERNFYGHVLANPVRYNYPRTDVLTS